MPLSKSQRWPRLLACAPLILLALGSAAFASDEESKRASAKIEPWVIEHTTDGQSAEFLVVLKEQADLRAAAELRTKEEKGLFVYNALYRVAQESQVSLLAWLSARGVEHRSFYIVNMIWVRGDRSIVQAIAERADVERIEGNPRGKGVVAVAEPQVQSLPFAVEPNIAYTNADVVWGMGYRGQGVVVGGQDTGYQWDHPALLAQYRGWNGSNVDHNFNWHDSIHSGGGSCGANSVFPCDDYGHGTHTMGTAVGDDGLGNQIGMAPDARWICSRNMDQGNGTPATYMESFEFFLAPYPVGGNPGQGNPLLAPDVTVNSWLCPTSEGCVFLTLQAACQAQRAAGIVTVVAAGNSGSSCSSVDSPAAIYDEVYSVGALNHNNGAITGFSSRGPVTVDGSGRVKPDLSAPGSGIRSCYPGNSYQGGWNGTSMATPHVAGAVALLLSAHPSLRGQVDLIEQILNETAERVANNSCGGSGWPNNVYGHGRLDVLAAVNSVYALELSTPNTAQRGVAGSTVTYTLDLRNNGFVSDSYQLAAGATAFPVVITPTTIGPITAGNQATATVTVQIPAGTPLGVAAAVTITATSNAFLTATDSITLQTTSGPGCLFRNGNGVNPTDYACVTAPVLGTTWITSYGSNAGTIATVLGVSYGGSATGPAFGTGEWLIALSPAPLFITGNMDILIPIPNDGSLAGAQLATQGLRLDAGPQLILLNAQDLVVGT